jgi:hypothetical protein
MSWTVDAGPAGQEVRACAVSIHKAARSAGCWACCHSTGRTALAWHLTPCRSRSVCSTCPGLLNAGSAVLGTDAVCCSACRYPLQLGWFVVRNPNQAALLRGTSSVSARQQEDIFFDSAAPWNRMPSEQKNRLGETCSPGSLDNLAPSLR